MHLLELNNQIRKGVEKAGLIGQQFNTIGVRLVEFESGRIRMLMG